MKKPIFDSKEEFLKFMDDCFICCGTEINNYESSIRETYINAKDKGYIGKSISEEAEEIIVKYFQYGPSLRMTREEVIKIMEYIKLLKNKLEAQND